MSAANPKQISLTTGVDNAVIYTVPAGRKFIGALVPNSTYLRVVINGVQCVELTNTNYYLTPMPITLAAGTTVAKGVTYPFGLIGVEYDA